MLVAVVVLISITCPACDGRRHRARGFASAALLPLGRRPHHRPEERIVRHRLLLAATRATGGVSRASPAPPATAEPATLARPPVRLHSRLL
eukprot:2179840-Pyramimonas_sp.AAC.1